MFMKELLNGGSFRRPELWIILQRIFVISKTTAWNKFKKADKKLDPKPQIKIVLNELHTTP
jgi:hypothetical protein